MNDNIKDPGETPVLSSSTMDALNEFYADRDARERLFEDLKSGSEVQACQSSLTMDAFAEDWNESQFWYSQETATVLAKQLLENSSSDTTIAVISAPSVFVQLKNLLATGKAEKPKIFLLEFDERFAVFPEFVRYDFRDPFKLPSSIKGAIDHIICDPPFLSEDCQAKAAMTVRWLSRHWGLDQKSSNPVDENSKTIKESRLIVCTGERMESLVTKLYRPQGVATTSFLPTHARGLSNEFYCYANFECEDWEWAK